MLTERENLQIIRQAEKSNLSESEAAQFIKWAILVKAAAETLDGILKGHLDVVGMEGMLPQIVLTPKGAKAIIEGV